MALNQWFKFYGGEYLSDPKIASLTPQERSCWVTLLCLSSISSTPGTVEYLTVEALLQKSGIVWDPYEPDEWDRAKTVLDKFVRMKMVTKNEEGVIEILNWTKRQDTLMTAAERQAKYRENKKSNANVTERVTKVTLDKIREDKNINFPDADALEVVKVSDLEEKRPTKLPKDEKALSLCQWAEKRRGFPFTSNPAQLGAIGRAKKAGVSPSRLKDRWVELEGETWRNGFDWVDVVKSFDKRA